MTITTKSTARQTVAILTAMHANGATPDQLEDAAGVYIWASHRTAASEEVAACTAMKT